MHDFTKALEQLRQRGQFRERCIATDTQGAYVEIDGKRVLSFGGSDYLGLADDERVAEIVARAAVHYGVGARAAPFSSGHRHVHERLEQTLAQFLGCERALLFSSSQLSHIAAIPALVARGDAIFCDEFAQPSLLAGARLSGAKLEIYSHGDMTHLEFAMASSTAPRKMIVSDAIFPMQGDRAPIERLLDLSLRHDSWLLLDDSHGFGVLGTRGRGVLAQAAMLPRNIVYVSSLAEAAGGSGACLAGSGDLVDWLMQTVPAYGESPALSPAVAAGLLVSLKLVEEEESRREHLRELIRTLRAGLKDMVPSPLPSDSAIHTQMFADSRAAAATARALRDQDIWVPVITPSQAPGGTARMRITLTASHTTADVERLVETLSAIRAGTESNV